MASPAAVLTILVNASTRSAQAQLTALDRAGARTATNAQRNSLRTAAAYETAGKKISRVGTSMTRNISVPAAAAGAISVKFAMDFEESMTKVHTLAGQSTTDVKKWSDEILKLGPELGKSPRELAEALYFVTSSGIKAADAMNVVTVTAKASAAGLGETQTVADAVTSAMNSYSKSNLSAADATDVLVQAVRFGKGEPDELAKSIGRVIPVASKLGVPFRDVGSSLAGLTLQGLDAAEATTALRAVFMAALHPSTQASDALKSVGLTAEGLRKTLDEKGTLAMLNMLTQAFHGNVEEIGKVFPNVRALVGAFNLTGDSAERNRQIWVKMGKDVDATGQAFADTAKTPAFQMHQALAQLEASAIQLGIVLLPIVADIVEEFGKLAKVFTAFPWAKELLVFAIAVGPMTRLIGSVITLVGWYKKLAVAVGLANAAQAAGGAAGAAGAAGGAASATTATGRTIGSTAGVAGMTAAGVTAGTAFAAAFAGVAAALIQEKLTNLMQEQGGSVFGDALSKAGDLQETLNKIGAGGPIGNIRTIIDGIKGITGPSKEARDAADKLDATLEGVGKRHEFFGPAEQAQMIALAKTAGKSDEEIQQLRQHMTQINQQSFAPLLAKYQSFRKQFQSGNDTIRATGIANFRIMFRSMGNSANELRIKTKGIHDQINSQFANVRQAGIKNFQELFRTAGNSTAALSAKSNALKQALNSDFKDIRQAGITQTKQMADQMGIKWRDLAAMIRGKADDIRLVVFQMLKSMGLSDAAIQTEIGRRSTGAFTGGGKAQSKKGSGQTSVTPGGLQKGGMMVPGSGSGDKYPVQAMLEPGEIFGVLNRNAASAIDATNKMFPRFGMQAGGTQGPLTATTTGRPGTMRLAASRSAEVEVAAGNALIQALKKKAGGGPKVQQMIKFGKDQAAQHFPYVYGGGHGGFSGPYDCSGYVSAILHAGGLLGSPITTDGLKTFGQSGVGKQVTIGVRGSTGANAHTMMRVGKFFFESGGSGGGAHVMSGWDGAFPIKRHPQGMQQGGFMKAEQLLRKKGLVTDPRDPAFIGWGLKQGGVLDPRLNQSWAMQTGYGGPQLEPWVIAAVAEAAGLPGWTFSQIAHGESNYRPGAKGHDTGGTQGYGLFQMTMGSGPDWATNNAIIERFGGIQGMLNPWKNAQASKALGHGGIGPWHGTKFVTDNNRHYTGKEFDVRKLGGAAAANGNGKTKTRKPSRLLTELGIDINKLPLNDDKKAALKHTLRRLPGLAADQTKWDELAQRAAELDVEGGGKGAVGGLTNIAYLQKELETVWAWRNAVVLVHNILVNVIEKMNEQLARATGGTDLKFIPLTKKNAPGTPEAKRLKKLGYDFDKKSDKGPGWVPPKKGKKTKIDTAAVTTLLGQANTKLGETSTSLTELQGTVVGADPFKVYTNLPAIESGIFGGTIFSVQKQLKDAQASTTATDTDATKLEEAMKEIQRLKVSQLQAPILTAIPQMIQQIAGVPYAGAFAQGGMVPGPRGRVHTALVHGGETISPAGGQPSVQVQINGHVMPFQDHVGQVVEVYVDGKLRKDVSMARRRNG